jgi:hypothetical protein
MNLTISAPSINLSISTLFRILHILSLRHKIPRKSARKCFYNVTPRSVLVCPCWTLLTWSYQLMLYGHALCYSQLRAYYTKLLLRLGSAVMCIGRTYHIQYMSVWRNDFINTESRWSRGLKLLIFLKKWENCWSQGSCWLRRDAERVEYISFAPSIIGMPRSFRSSH